MRKSTKRQLKFNADKDVAEYLQPLTQQHLMSQVVNAAVRLSMGNEMPLAERQLTAKLAGIKQLLTAALKILED